MKVILLGDTHFGNHKQFGGPIVRGINRRCQEILDAVEREVRKAVEEDPDIEHVIQVGDFFDQARPPAAVIEATIQMMKRFPNLHWHLMKGNHDVASFDAPSALAPLAHIPGISVYEQPTLLEIGGRKYGLIPYIDHSAFTALHMAKLVLVQSL
jgi:DNA repair exonuclease SbcCD nuclease subunit